MPSKLYDTGMKIRREVLSDAYVDAAMKNVDAFNQEFQELITEYCWGAVWGRKGLNRKQRSLNNLCMLAILNRPHEFKAHVRGALRNGVTVREIQETLMQVAIYAGVPTGVDAFRNAREALKEEKVDTSKTID
jgi:4-carboxymuconolactone decarboxylase